MRDRVNWTAAAGSATVASNADSGNNIRMASVVGATVGAMPIPATTAPSRLAPIAAVGMASAIAPVRAAASSASAQACWRRCESAMTLRRAPATRSSGACSRAIIADVSRMPRCWRAIASCAAAVLPASQGATTPATKRQTASTTAAGTETAATTAVAATASTAATAIGTRARTSMLASSSTSAPTRAARSPLCSPTAAAAGPWASR